jgi:hypothetical protein
MRNAWTRNLMHGTARHAARMLEPAEEGAKCRERSRQRPARCASPAARCHQAAEGFDIQSCKIAEAGLVTEIVAQKAQKLAQITLIGVQRRGRQSTLECEMRKPRSGGIAEIMRERQAAFVPDSVSRHRATLRALVLKKHKLLRTSAVHVGRKKARIH